MKPAFHFADSDPLLGGIHSVREVDDATGRRALALDIVRRFGAAPSVAGLHALARLGRDLANSDSAQIGKFEEELAACENAGAIWLAATMFESSEKHSEAAALLKAMPDREWGEGRAMRLLACARNRLCAGLPIWNYIREAMDCVETRQSVLLADRLLQQAGTLPGVTTKRVALVGTGSLNFWAPVLRPFSFAAGVHLDLFTGQFDQYRQEILDPKSALAKFRPDIVIIAADWRSLGIAAETPDPEKAVEEWIGDLATLWKTCADRWNAAVIQHNFEVPEVDPLGRLSAILPGGRAAVLRRLNAALAAAPVAVLDIDHIASLFGKRTWSNPVHWTAAKQYPHPEALPFLARHQASLLRAVSGLTSKCAVVDLDGTLWGGTIGEDGVGGIRLGGSGEGEAFLEFQRYLLGLRARGIPLAVCSRNNHEDAVEPFRSHPEMLIRLDDVAVFLANWEPKPDNLRKIAKDLNLGLESLVFIDDHPVERARVRAELPSVAVPEMPADPALYATALHRTLLFESLSLTGEDRGRADEYRANAQRQALQATSAGVDDFLESLAMRIELRPFDQTNLPRIVQLINKTNQFNLTTRRTSDSAVKRMMDDSEIYTQFMRLRDKFGDSGITGVLVAVKEGNSYRIDQWLLSCRVLGRRIEEVMLTGLFRHAAAAGLSEIVGEYIPTAKNAQVADIYPKFGFEPIGGGRFRISLQKAELAFPGWAHVELGE